MANGWCDLVVLGIVPFWLWILVLGMHIYYLFPFVNVFAFFRITTTINLSCSIWHCFHFISTCLNLFSCSYPQRVSKVKATVRYMFHSPEDVRWFKVWVACLFNRELFFFQFVLLFMIGGDARGTGGSKCSKISLFFISTWLLGWLSHSSFCMLQPVEVWSKCGRRGRIKEPVGTHGMFLHICAHLEDYN